MSHVLYKILVHVILLLIIIYSLIRIKNQYLKMHIKVLQFLFNVRINFMYYIFQLYFVFIHLILIV